MTFKFKENDSTLNLGRRVPKEYVANVDIYISASYLTNPVERGKCKIEIDCPMKLIRAFVQCFENALYMLLKSVNFPEFSI